MIDYNTLKSTRIANCVPKGTHHSSSQNGHLPHPPCPILLRKTLPYATKLLQKCRPHLAPRILQLTHTLILKYGTPNVFTEAQTIHCISKNTSIPVPNIIAAFQLHSGGEGYMLMKRCPGEPLCNVIRELDMEERRRVLDQLRGYMDQLRGLEPPRPGQVGSVVYGSLDDERLRDEPCGPFETVVDFHRAIRGDLDSPTGHEECDKMISIQESRSYDIKFTHGDLSLRHVYYINGIITGIIDWESAGWFPDYWEYAMTWDSFWEISDLRNDISAFLQPYLEEQQMEDTRRRLFRGM